MPDSDSRKRKMFRKMMLTMLMMTTVNICDSANNDVFVDFAADSSTFDESDSADNADGAHGF